MDIFKFIDSKDIREYLRARNYEFSTLEKAWLIYQSKKQPMKVRHAAWEELIATTQNCDLPKRMNCRLDMSLHTYLKKYIDFEDRLVSNFYNQSGVVYQYVVYPDDGGRGSFNGGACYSTAGKAIDAYFNDYVDDSGHFAFSKFGIRQHFIDKDTSALVIFSPEKEIQYIYPAQDLSDEDTDLSAWGFDGMWFNFPVPFKMGDIVWSPDSFINGPFVYLGKTPEDLDNEKTREFVINNGDYTDMVAFGYFATCEGGRVFYDSIATYMSLEYYDKELSPAEKILLPISNFVKKEIDLDLLLSAYSKLTADSVANTMQPFGYTDEGLILAGLKPQEK